MKARLLGGIAALVVAVIGTVLLFNYVQGADRRALANTETEDVLVVKQTVPAGTPASQLNQYLTTKAVPRAAVAQDAIEDLSSVGAKVTAVGLVPGEQLLSSRLVEASTFIGPARVEVPTGLQEITVRLGIDRVVGGSLQAGDTVGVFISLGDAATGGGNGTQLTFHKVLVTAVQFSSGQAVQTQGEATQASSTGALNTEGSKQASSDSYLVTLARDAVDAEKLVYAAEFGKIYLSKEPAGATEGTSGVVNQTKVFR